ncbi:MAG TPA: SOS response-associated peptidase [Streptosporangiaceae bacterium]|nr:SOS response-associated peptidase [Streptosporangiaceae bacterium]
MCGRYASARKRIELLEEFSVQRDQDTEPLKPDYNVAPTKAVYTVIDRAARPADEEAASADGGDSRDASTGAPERALRVMRWGLVPFWAKDVKIGSRMINARAETVAEKPAFRRAFAKRRCLMPADGYYEWQQLPGAAKQPMYISRADGRPLAFAGLYELWRDPAVNSDDQDAWLWTTTIITTSAPDEIGMIHDRMPMLIDPGSWADWLDPANNDVADLKALLTPAMVDDLTTWPVSTAVNSVRNNGPELIKPVSVGLAGPLTAAAPRSGASAAAAQAARDFGDDGTGALF